MEHLALSPHHQLARKEIIILAIIATIIVILGIILIAAGLNEPLYSDNTVIYTIFNIITQLGGEYAYIVIFIIIFLCIDKEFAERIIFSFLIVLHFTTFFKLLFQDGRPSTNIVDGEPIEDGYGFPSGHTTGTVSFWGYIFLSMIKYENKKTKLIVQIFTGFLLVLVPISRMVIGVHDLEDVVGGYSIAIALVVVYMVLEPKFNNLEWSTSKRILFGILASLLLWIGGAVILYFIYPDENINQINDLAQACGILAGLSISVPLEHKYIQYNPKSLNMKRKIWAGIIGVVIGIGFYFGLSVVFGFFPETAQHILRGVRYFLFAIILGLGLPYLNKILLMKK